MRTFHNMLNRTRPFSLILIVLFSILLLQTFYIPAYGLSSAGKAPRIRFADIRFLGASPVYVALEKGYFSQEGLEIAHTFYSVGKDCLGAVVSGKADIAFVADYPIAFEIMKGTKILVITTLSNQSNTHEIIARRNQGIASPEDLQGKKIGVTLGTNLQFVLDSFLLFHQVPRDHIQLINLPAERMEEALQKREIDAAILWGPTLIKMKRNLGKDAVVFEANPPYIFRETLNIVAKEEFIRQNPATIKALLRALLKADNFIQGDREEALQIAAKYMEMKIQTLRESWKIVRPNVSLNPLLVENLENESKWALKNSLTKATQMPNFLDYIYFDGLDSVRPDAVTIIH